MERLQGILPFLLFAVTINPVSPDAGGGGREKEGYPVILSATSTAMELDPYNVTISHLMSRSVEVSWNCRGQNLQDKYEVTLKPLRASYRVIETVPYNTCYLYMDKLEPDSNYQVSVTSISGRVRKRSSSVIFRTYMEDYTDEILEEGEDEKKGDPAGGEDDLKGTADQKIKLSKDRIKLPRVRLVEISLVGMALILWAGAIVLFFHRWGKIRMLLPYQPDYKEMKRSTSVCANCSMTPHHQYCRLQPVVQHPTTNIVGEYCGGTMGLVGGSLPGPSSTPLSHNKLEQTSKETRRGHQHGVYRKTKSAEQLGHFNCKNTNHEDSNSSPPYMDDFSIDMDLVYTDF